eukprot:scaffold238411_cov17-Tisochrysis_lutea.AAC.2
MEDKQQQAAAACHSAGSSHAHSSGYFTVRQDQIGGAGSDAPISNHKLTTPQARLQSRSHFLLPVQ